MRTRADIEAVLDRVPTCHRLCQLEKLLHGHRHSQLEFEAIDELVRAAHAMRLELELNAMFSRVERGET